MATKDQIEGVCHQAMAGFDRDVTAVALDQDHGHRHKN